MTKKYLYSRQRFARHLDSKIEQMFDKVLRNSFVDYFEQNPEDLKEDCVLAIKESMTSTVLENVDLLIKDIQRAEKNKKKEMQDLEETTQSLRLSESSAPIVTIKKQTRKNKNDDKDSERSEKGERSERGERSEKGERSERGERSEKGERVHVQETTKKRSNKSA